MARKSTKATEAAAAAAAQPESSSPATTKKSSATPRKSTAKEDKQTPAKDDKKTPLKEEKKKTPAAEKKSAAAKEDKKTPAKEEKKAPARKTPRKSKAAEAAAPPSKIPAWARFPLVAVLSFGIGSLGYTLLGALTHGELAAISGGGATWIEVAILATWRLMELAVGWFGDLDSLDVATLNLLSHGPPLYLLTVFYNLSPVTAMASFAIDVVSAAAPFYALRPLSAIHTRSARLPNRELAGLGLQLYTGALSTVIYTVVMVLSLRFVLPRALAVYFAGLPSLEPAYGASYLAVLPATVQFGAAASSFIYAPFATTGRVKEDDAIGRFDPGAATLRETVAWNFLGYTAKTKVVIRRTAVAVLLTATNTYLACHITISGVEPAGAAAYAGAWAVATLLSGLGLAFVGGQE